MKARWERSDTRRHRQFDRFDIKTGESVTSCGGVQEGMNGLGSKPGKAGLTGLDLKIGGGLDAVKIRAEGTWRHREACVQTKRNCEGGVAVRGFYKNLVRFAPVWVCIVVNSVVVFSSFVGTLYCWAWLVGGCS